jgi:hypothetical protein
MAVDAQDSKCHTPPFQLASFYYMNKPQDVNPPPKCTPGFQPPRRDIEDDELEISSDTSTINAAPEVYQRDASGESLDGHSAESPTMEPTEDVGSLDHRDTP